MPRAPRSARGGVIYHVLNRSNASKRIFRREADYDIFLQALSEAIDRIGTRVLAFCVMPDHWHLVIWPRRDGELSEFMRWLTVTHTQRWHAAHRTSGSGHLYQGRFKSFPVQPDGHVHAVCQYVIENPVRSELVRRPDQWKWSSLGAVKAAGDGKAAMNLFSWPEAKNAVVESEATDDGRLEALRRSVVRGCPFGEDGWSSRTAARLGLEFTLHPRGRPRKTPLKIQPARKDAKSSKPAKRAAPLGRR